MKFTAILQQGESKNVTGIIVPAGVIAELGGKRVPITVTINGYSYKTTVGSMNGKAMISVAAEHRAASGIRGGEEIEVEVVRDETPRTVVVPGDLRVALDEANAEGAFEALAYSHRKEHVRVVEDAKKPETRARRIEKVVQSVLKN